MSMDTLPQLAVAHLLLRLQPLNRTLRAAVEAQRMEAESLSQPELKALCVTDQQVLGLLEKVSSHRAGKSTCATLTEEERERERDLQDRAQAIAVTLPLDKMAQQLGLTDFEREAILVCAAPEQDRAYERIYAYILDDLNRRFPCVELLTGLTCASIEERAERRHALSIFGKLRRFGLLSPINDPPTQLRQEFRLGNDVLEFLSGAGEQLVHRYLDSEEIQVPDCAGPPCQVDQNQFEHLAAGLREGSIAAVGIWGARQHGLDDVVLALASASHCQLRRLPAHRFDQGGPEFSQMLEEQFRIATGLRAAVWVETELLCQPGYERFQRLLADQLSHCSVPVILTGEYPWRPANLVQADGYAELELVEPAFQQREQVWSEAFPDLQAQEIQDLAARFRLSDTDIRTVSKVARTRARLSGNGHPTDVRGELAAACSVITRRTTSHFTTIVTPRRKPGDLVLPQDMHRQIMEVGTFFRLRRTVDHDWGFGYLANGQGMNALFTGEPGTGKTLAAEVIAGALGVSLYKVDLARVVSKWVGETEKNLEAAFREAEESQAVLFFDEAEALFGRRAEVQHGTDRYANLEVSYLLQRLENSLGLVILASNVKDQIDPAFTRRFQVVMHFAKPGPPERRRIWNIAFPKSAPVAKDVDLDVLARLSMTGAGIVSSARSAALLAADAGCVSISMAHVVRATARQFRREARVLTAHELGPYGALLQEVS